MISTIYAHTLLRSEQDMRTALIQLLQAQGLVLADRIVCHTGEPDIVIADHSAIFEIKYRLTRKALHQALGQVLLYRQCLNPHARAIIIGYETPEIFSLLPYIKALNVEVVCWKDVLDPKEQVSTRENTSSSVPIRSRQRRITLFPYLQWNVARLAMNKGWKNVPALTTHMGIQRQGVYGIWNNNAAQVSLEMLTRLARALRCDPGDWFSWKDVEERALVWQVAVEAEKRGLTMSTLSFKAELHMRSLRPIWQGEAQAVAIDTLARIAHVLNTIQPFAIEDLFTWN